MGSASSKKKKTISLQDIRITEREDATDHIYDSPDDIKIHTISKIDEEILRLIKKDLHETPEMFVLNNVLMSIMFFENYQKDSKRISRKVLQTEGYVMRPDIVLDKINKNVRYRPIHGAKKHFSETIAPIRIYPVNQDIEIDDPTDNQMGQSISVFRVKPEDSIRKGFVKLREVTSEAIENKDNVLHVPIINQREPSPSTSRSSTDNDSDTNYAYTTITNLKTPKPIEIIQGLQNSNPEMKSCCVYRMIKRTDSLEDDVDLSDLTEEDLFETVSYLNVRKYMKLFANNLFPNSVGQCIGFEESDIAAAESIPGKLFCPLTEREASYILYEILPSVRICWPEFQTFLLQGNLISNGNSWPNPELLRRMKGFDCTLVPKGYFKKRGVYPEADLEWEIHFPLAENYLESCMSHAQIKCYLFLLTLHKYYIDDVTKQHGLLVEHIRTHIFWECAENFNNWPEHRLGNKLINIINNLSSKVRKAKLNDFFVRDKNIFQNIPKKYLEHANKSFHDILQAPLMHFLRALRNIRYTSGKYYPPLDFKELYRILESTNSNKSQEALIVTPNIKRRWYDDRETQLEHLKELEIRKRRFEKKQKQLSQGSNVNLGGMEERRGSVDSIDVDWICEKHFDIYKKRSILKFFRDTFLAIAKKSAKLGSNKQTLFYLKQAWYLSKILDDECAALGDDTEEMLNEINTEIVFCNSRRDIDNDDGDVSIRSEAIPEEEEEEEEEITEEETLDIKPRKSVAFIVN